MLPVVYARKVLQGMIAQGVQLYGLERNGCFISHRSYNFWLETFGRLGSLYRLF